MADNAMVRARQGRLHDPYRDRRAQHLRAEDRSFLKDCVLDGLMLIFADYDEGLRRDRAGNPAAARDHSHDAERLDRARPHRASAGGHAGGFCGARWRDGQAGMDMTTARRAIGQAEMLGRCGTQGVRAGDFRAPDHQAG